MDFQLLTNGLVKIFNGSRAELVVKQTMKTQGLVNDDRIWLSRSLYGISSLRSRLEYKCHKQIWFKDLEIELRLLVMAFVYTNCEQQLYLGDEISILGFNDFVALKLGQTKFNELQASQDVEIEWPTVDLDLICFKYSYPNWLGRLILDSSKDLMEAQALANSFNYPGPITIRTNTNKQSRLNLMSMFQFETKPTKLSDVGLIFNKRQEINNNEFYKLGFFEVQDEGSQLISISTEAKNGIVIDYCCGRGGKALHLLDMMDSGTLYLHDVDLKCLKQAQKRVSKVMKPGVMVKYACSNTDYLYGGRGGDTFPSTINDLNSDSTIISGDLNIEADVVLVDSPCSSLGTLRRGPNVRWETTPGSISIYPQLQKDILAQAQKLVKVGGILVYATCTFNRQECGDVKDWFESEFKMFTPSKLGLFDESSIQLMPHIHGTDAFYICKWNRFY